MSEGRYAVIGVWNMDASRWEEQQRVLHEQLVPDSEPESALHRRILDERSLCQQNLSTIVLEDKVAAEDFKAFVSGNEARPNQEQSGVRNESPTVVKVSAEARRDM